MKADGSDAQIATHKGKNIMDLIQSRRKSIEEALPRNIDVDRFTRICLVNVAGNRRLLECEPVTLLTAVMQCAQLGLEPGGPLGMAHLIPKNGSSLSLAIGAWWSFFTSQGDSPRS